MAFMSKTCEIKSTKDLGKQRFSATIKYINIVCHADRATCILISDALQSPFVVTDVFFALCILINVHLALGHEDMRTTDPEI